MKNACRLSLLCIATLIFTLASLALPTRAMAISSDLSVTVSASSSTVIPGDTIVYAVSIHNSGPDTATSPKLINVISPGVTYVSDTAPVIPVQSSGRTFTYNFASMANGATIAFNIVVSVKSSDTPNMLLQNSATVSSAVSDPDLTDNQALTDVRVRSFADVQAFAVFSAEVQVAGQPGKIIDTNLLPPMPDSPSYNFGGTTVTAGRRIEFSASAINFGPDPADNIRIKFFLPTGATPIENTINPLANPTGLPGRCYVDSSIPDHIVVNCQYGAANVGASASAKLQMIIPPNTPKGTQLSMDAIASSDLPDPNASNNITGIQFDAQPSSDLVVQTLANPNPVIAGRNVNYRINLTSNGPSTAKNVVVDDLLSAGGEFLQIVSANITGGGGTCYLERANQAHVLCGLGDIPPGRIINIDLVLQVDPSAPSGTTLTDAVTVTGESALRVTGDLSDNVSVGDSADVSITHDVSDLIVGPGGTTFYTLTVHNDGPSVARNLQVVETLASGLSYLVDSAGCTEAPAGTLTCNLGSLAPGASRSFDIAVRVKCDAAAGSKLSSSASLTSSAIDSSAGNNAASSSSSNIGASVCAPPTPPSILNTGFTPSTPTVKVTGKTAKVTVTAVSGATLYIIQVQKGAGKVVTKKTNSTTASFGNLAKGKYTVKVNIQFSDGQGNPQVTQASAAKGFTIK